MYGTPVIYHFKPSHSTDFTWINIIVSPIKYLYTLCHITFLKINSSNTHAVDQSTYNPKHGNIFFLGSAASKEGDDDNDKSQEDNTNGWRFVFPTEEVHIWAEETLGYAPQHNQDQPRQLEKKYIYLWGIAYQTFKTMKITEL